MTTTVASLGSGAATSLITLDSIKPRPATDRGPALPSLTLTDDGSGLRVLTHYRGGRLSAFAGSFSPNGRWIVYRLQDNEAGTSALWKMWTDGTHRQKIFERDGLRARGIDWGAPS